MRVNSRTIREGPLNRRDMSMEQMPDKIGQISPISAETHEPSTIAAIAMNGASSADTDNNLVMDSHIKYTNKSAGIGVNIRLVTVNPQVENDKSSPLVMTAIPSSVVASNGGKTQHNSLTDEIMSADTMATIANSAWLDGLADETKAAVLLDDYHSIKQLFRSQEIENQRAGGAVLIRDRQQMTAAEIVETVLRRQMPDQRNSECENDPNGLVSDTNDGNDEENESGYNGFDNIHLMEGVNVNNKNAYGGSMPNIDQPSGGNNTSSVGNYLSDESQKHMLAHGQDFRNLEFAFGEMGTNGRATISGGSGSRNISLTGGSDGKPTYECPHSGKKSTLTRYINQCPYCPYKSIQRRSLVVHVRKNHSDLPQLTRLRRQKISTKMEGANRSDDLPSRLVIDCSK